MTDRYPILSTKGIRWTKVVAVGDELHIIGKAPLPMVGEIAIIVHAKLSKVTFEYAIVSPETGTITYYTGTEGDPDKDSSSLTGW